MGSLTRDLKRISRSWTLYFLLFTSIGTAIYNSLTVQYISFQAPLSAYHVWIGAGYFPLCKWFYMVFPVFPSLIAIPFLNDAENGFMQQELVRNGRRKYFKEKSRNIFIIGTVLVILMLIINLGVCSLFHPLISSDPSFVIGLSRLDVGYRLFYQHTGIYTLLYICFNGLYGGLITILATGAYFFFENFILAAATPTLLHYIIYCFSNIFLIYSAFPGTFLVPNFSRISKASLVIIFVQALLGFGVWYWAGKRYEKEIRA